MKSFLVLYTALSYSLYLSFIVVSWTRPQDIYDQTPREKGFIQYCVDSYISEKTTTNSYIRYSNFPAICMWLFLYKVVSNFS